MNRRTKPDWIGVFVLHSHEPVTQDQWKQICGALHLRPAENSVWLNMGGNVRVRAQNGTTTVAGKKQKDWREAAKVAYMMSQCGKNLFGISLTIAPGVGIEGFQDTVAL
jgi:hypothetical protein